MPATRMGPGPVIGTLLVGTLGGNRTPNLLVRSQTLYPLSYEGKASQGQITRLTPF